MPRTISFGQCLCLLAMLPAAALAQQAAVSTPLHTSADSFFERSGVTFGFDLRGGNPYGDGGSSVVGLTPGGAFTPDGSLRFRQGGAAATAGGGFDPAAGETVGAELRGQAGRAFFGFAAAQGSTRTSGVQSSGITLAGGGTAYIAETSQRPFVTGFIPVVGGGFSGSAVPNFGIPAPRFQASGTQSVLAERLQRLKSEKAAGSASDRNGAAANFQQNARAAGKAAGRPPTVIDQLNAARVSSAGQAASSLAEIRRQQADQQAVAERQALESLQLAHQAARDGKPALARHFYQQAASRSSGPIKAHALSGIRALTNP